MVSEKLPKKKKSVKSKKDPHDYLGYILAFNGTVMVIMVGIIAFSLEVMEFFSYIIMIMYASLFLATIIIIFIEIYKKENKFIKMILIFSAILLFIMLVYGIVYVSIIKEVSLNFGNSNFTQST